MPECLVKITPEQFETVRQAVSRPDVVFHTISYDATVDVLRSVGVEPEPGVTYRFVVVADAKLLNKRVTAKTLSAAWEKYTRFFGEEPHGTEKQLAALLQLVPQNAVASDPNEHRLQPEKEI